MCNYFLTALSSFSCLVSGFCTVLSCLDSGFITTDSLESGFLIGVSSSLDSGFLTLLSCDSGFLTVLSWDSGSLAYVKDSNYTKEK